LRILESDILYELGEYEKSNGILEFIKQYNTDVGLLRQEISKHLPKILDGAGVAIVSTSKGLLTDRKARKENFSLIL
jgi:small subunit ribosomal protein S8